MPGTGQPRFGRQIQQQGQVRHQIVQDEAITFTDLVRGEITFQPEHVPDYVIVRGNGHPLYTLVNPVDDALMEITHVLRGEDLLSSTPRQIALYRALIDITERGEKVRNRHTWTLTHLHPDGGATLHHPDRGQVDAVFVHDIGDWD